MKKIIAILGLALLFASCEKAAEAKTADSKTAYIDTSKLMEDYAESKDLEAKYEEQGKVVSKKYQVAEENLNAEVEAFRRNAQANGQAWAQQKAGELQQKKQQLEYAVQTEGQQFQLAHANERDSIVKTIKEFIKGYGKKNGYAYIYGTGDAATVLYAEDKYDITAEVTKLLNEDYASRGKKDNKPTAKNEETSKK